MNFPTSPDLRDPQLEQRLAEEEVFNLRLAIATVLDHWQLMVGIFATGIAIGLIKTWITPPQFEASALVEVESRSSGFAVGPEMMESYSPWTPPATATQIEILKSRRVLGAAAEQLGLTVGSQPLYRGQFGAAMARHYHGTGLASPPWYIPGAAKRAWGGEEFEVGHFAVTPTGNGRTFILVAGEAGQYTLRDDSGRELGRGKVQTELAVPDGGSEIRLLISKLTARPGTEFMLWQRSVEEAADTLRTRLRVSERGARGAFAGSGILELSVTADTPQEASDSANAIANTYLLQNVERLSQGAQSKLEFLNAQLPRLQSEMEGAEQALLAQRTKNGSLQLSEGAKSILEALTSIEKEISELELQRAELMQTLTPEHPAVAAILRKLDQLHAQKARIDSQIASLPDAESRALQLERNAKVSAELYISLLNKAQELKIAKAGTIGNVHIVDTAVPEYGPVEPKPGRLLLSWSALGFVCGLAVVFLRKHLNVKLDWAEDAERRIGIPVYATIPFSSKQSDMDSVRANGKGGALLAEIDPKDVAVESLRSLRASLHFAMMEAKRNLVVITGSTPNVGKSFVAANLARLVADSGKKVLLIDADMRKGRMHKVFGLTRSLGLSEGIAGSATTQQIRQTTGVDNFWVITTGKLPPNPAELLASDKFIEIVESSCKDFDLVIVDTPPILNLADTVVVARSAGALFVTIRGGVSTVPDVQDCVQRFAKNGIKVDGLIFNGLKPGVGSYVHPQYYHYRYRYGRYRYGQKQ